MAHYFEYKSEQKVFNPGSPLEFFDFLSPEGPTGGRNVIDKLIIRLTGTITVAGALFNGRDVPRLISQIQLESRTNRVRWSLSGLKSRMASIMLNGPEQYIEHTNIAVGAAQAVDLSLVIPLTKSKSLHRGKDFSMPADLFKKLVINCATLGSAAPAGVTLSANVLNVSILAQYHEEHNAEFKVEDSVIATDFNSATECKLSLGGPVHDLFIMKEGTTSGGDVVTSLTDARIEDLGTPTLTFGDLKAGYTTKRGYGNTQAGATPGGERFSEPVRDGFAMPLMVSDFETSNFDGRIVDTMKINLGSPGLAGCSAIYRQVLPRDESAYKYMMSKFKIKPDQMSVKTRGKTRKDIAGWPDDEVVFMPLTAPIRR